MVDCTKIAYRPITWNQVLSNDLGHFGYFRPVTG